MDLKPLPFEPLSQDKLNKKSKSYRNTKVKRPQNPSPNNKLFKEGCKKISGFINGKTKHSLKTINDLEKTLHRMILNLHKKKRKISSPKKKKK